MSEDLSAFDPQTKKNIQDWLTLDYDDETKAYIKKLLKEKPSEISEAFYTRLAFGTGGLRGIMGIGSNRMNVYTVKGATQGLANYVLKQPKNEKGFSIVIGYDSRNNSKLFAEEAAKVLSANHIKVYLYPHLRPVPLVSFAVRHLGAIAGIMITASHNPPEYNGYKVYWADGAQVLPPHDVGIINEVNLIDDPTQVKSTSFPNPMIEYISEKVDTDYIDAVRPLQLQPDINKKEGSKLKIVYTSLYGAGITMVPRVLHDWGFTDLHFVDEQIIPNGNFPTTPRPNPEEKEALDLGIKKLQTLSADILIATDPDSDRMGLVALCDNKPIIFTGNQIACICLEHILKTLTKNNKLPSKAAFIKTIVTSELFAEIAKSYKKPCFNVLTGFKYIGKMIREWEEVKDGYQYIYGGEESYGTLLGTHARDKDAVIAAALIAEVALEAKLNGLNLLQYLYKIYGKYGIYREKLISITYTGKEGVTKMKTIMDGLRKNEPKVFNNIPVVAIDDYKTSQRTNVKENKKTAIDLPKSNVLVYWLEDESRLVIRPSGTEPKIKLYGEVVLKKFQNVEEGIQLMDKKVDELLQSLKKDLS
jgi:phosphomannomutase